MAVVTPTDRPKSVRNSYVIELFCGVVCVVTLPFWHFFCWCRGFCHRTESDLFPFLLENPTWWGHCQYQIFITEHFHNVWDSIFCNLKITFDLIWYITIDRFVKSMYVLWYRVIKSHMICITKEWHDMVVKQYNNQ